jgi:tRNA pseudouridine32 synthase/23S rRNA pseudouridine746 synthase
MTGPSTPYAPPEGPIPVIHEDDDILVVAKPAGLLSVPGRGPDLADCLLSRLQALRPETLLCHRLDRDTSGIMVFALTKEAQRRMGRLFETRAVTKRYAALVWGAVAEAEGTVDLPLIVDWPNRPLQHVDHARGRAAVTDWRRMGVEGPEAAPVTRMRLMPRTGRSHQLRVHMRELGHPIWGDPFYAEGAAARAPRMMLHAEGLKFAHPATGKMLRLAAPCPF